MSTTTKPKNSKHWQILFVVASGVISGLTYFIGASEFYFTDLDSVYQSGVVARQFDKIGPGLQGDFISGLGGFFQWELAFFNPIYVQNFFESSRPLIWLTMYVGALLIASATIHLSRSLGHPKFVACVSGILSAYFIVGINPFVMTVYVRQNPANSTLIALVTYLMSLVIRLSKSSEIRNLSLWTQLSFGISYFWLVFPDRILLIIPFFTLLSISRVVTALATRTRNDIRKDARLFSKILLIVFGAFVTFNGVGLVGLFFQSSAFAFRSSEVRSPYAESIQENPMEWVLTGLYPSGTRFTSVLFLIFVFMIGIRLIRQFHDKNSANQMRFAVALGFIMVLLVYSILYSFSSKEIGPQPHYLQALILPYLICLATNEICNSDFVSFTRIKLVHSQLALAIIVLLLQVSWLPRNWTSSNSGFTPAADAQIAFLKKNLSLESDSQFRGRVIVYSGLQQTQRQVFEYLNLHQMSIPTLFTLSHSESAQSKLFYTALLQDRRRETLRASIWVDSLPRNLIEWSGVRFILSNSKISRTWLRDTHISGTFKFLYEVQNPNLSGFILPSPLHNYPVTDSLKLLGGAENRLSKTVEEVNADARSVGLLGSRILISSTSFHVEASSDRPIRLVLPLEYSNCLKFRGENSKAVKIERAIGLFTSITFNGRINLEIRRQLTSVGISTCTADDAQWLIKNYDALFANWQ